MCRAMGSIPHEVYNRIAQSCPPGQIAARYFVRKQLFSLLRKMEEHGEHRIPGMLARRVCIAAFADIGTFYRIFGPGPVRFEMRITDQNKLNQLCSFQVCFRPVSDDSTLACCVFFAWHDPHISCGDFTLQDLLPISTAGRLGLDSARKQNDKEFVLWVCTPSNPFILVHKCDKKTHMETLHVSAYRSRLGKQVFQPLSICAIFSESKWIFFNV